MRTPLIIRTRGAQGLCRERGRRRREREGEKERERERERERGERSIFFFSERGSLCVMTPSSQDRVVTLLLYTHTLYLHLSLSFSLSLSLNFSQFQWLYWHECMVHCCQST